MRHSEIWFWTFVLFAWFALIILTSTMTTGIILNVKNWTCTKSELVNKEMVCIEYKRNRNIMNEYYQK